MNVTPNCNPLCEAMPECSVCHRRKQPWGRSAPLEMANGLCDFECPGNQLEPKAGHLWPGEFAVMGVGPTPTLLDGTRIQVVIEITRKKGEK